MEGRLDPLFYNVHINKFTSFFESVSLKDVTTIMMSGFGAGKQYQADENKGIIQIRPTNIDADGFLKYDRNVFVPDYGVTEKIKFDDIIFNNTNSQELVGKTAILKENKTLTFSNHITLIRVNKNKIIPDYLWIILNLYQRSKIFYSICTNWNNQSGVGLELLNSLNIPLPPIDIQQKIVALYQNACNEKQHKEAEAQNLLAGIDGYLLAELGITLPEENNSLENRIFTVQFSEITGGRFDPKLYDNKTKKIKFAVTNVDKNKFIAGKLKDYVLSDTSGDWGIEDEQEEYTKCLVIRATEFDNLFNLNLTNSRVKYRFIKNNVLYKMNIQENDILIEKSGGSSDQPVGRAAIITKAILDKETICFSNFIHKISVDTSKVVPDYLFCFLKTVHNIKLTDSMQSQTNGIRNLIMREYLNQNILIPIKENGDFDLQKQNQIASHIQQIRAQAIALREEAQYLLEAAKRDVERMILGES